MFSSRVVAAIDVGTHAIGFGWCVVSESNDEARTRKIHFCNQWDDQPAATAKNLSAVIVDSNGDLVAWGFEARRMWLMRADSLKALGARYFAGFKMDLAVRPATGEEALPQGSSAEGSSGDGDGVTERTGLQSPDEMTPSLLTMLLRQVVNKTRDQIEASGYDEDDIRWCLTVPAIWSDYQKAVMRDVAKNAGLPGEDGRVLLSLEPESAAHYARLCGVNVVADPDAEGFDLMTPGARFMVVDCGGGTVDITAYANDADGRMIEIGKSIGGRFGSDFLNRAFENEHLRDSLGGAEILDKVREECPDALLHLVDQWERAKLHVTLDQDESVNLMIPSAIDRRLGAALRRRLARRQDKVSDAIVLTPAHVHALFDKVVPATLDLIETQLDEMDRTRGTDGLPQVVLLVGGFSNSPYLQQAVKERLGSRAMVLVPPNPDIAVLFGAAHFCYDPQTRARRSRFTYGTESCRTFEEGADPQDFRYVSDEGRVLCQNTFAVFVQAGETVPTEAEVAHVFTPVNKRQKSIRFDIYATNDPDPRYVTDEGSDKIGEVEIDIRSVMRFPRAERAVRVHMKFGETELKVRAEVIHTGQQVDATVRFHSNY
ncbi:Hsp70 family protein [Streptomyces xanthochromogenes]|uniref:Hsp70 family protein n=1 Tax=Streptomyces xanthochromogenes TaxID=67384 RepID=UPI0038160C55